MKTAFYHSCMHAFIEWCCRRHGGWTRVSPGAHAYIRREDDDLDIDAIIEANKDTLPTLPGAHCTHVIHHHILSNRLPISTD